MLAVASPAQARARSTTKEIETVAFVGDSISHLSEGAITRKFEPDYTIEFAAVPGAGMADMLPSVQQFAATDPWAMIVELGTPDAYGDNTDWFNAFVNEVNALTSQRCVVLLTVTPELGSLADDIDAAIYYVGVTHHQFHGLDWGDIEYTKSSWVMPDHIHPTPSGQKELAKLEFSAVRSDCG